MFFASCHSLLFFLFCCLFFRAELTDAARSPLPGAFIFHTYPLSQPCIFRSTSHWVFRRCLHHSQIIRELWSSFVNVRCKEGTEVSLRLGPPLFLECYANVRVFLRDIKEPPLTYLSPKNKKKYGTGLTQRYSWYGGSRFNELLALPFILMIYKHLCTQQPTFGGKLCTDISPQTLSDQR